MLDHVDAGARCHMGGDVVCRVDSDRQSEPMCLVDAGLDLLVRELGQIGPVRRQELDQIGPRLVLDAHGVADGVGTVDLVGGSAEARPVPTGHADPLPRGEDAGNDQLAALLSRSEGKVDPNAADVAHRGDARLQRAAQVADRDRRRVRGRVALRRGHDVVRCGYVDVGVDQPGEEETPLRFDALRARGGLDSGL